MTKEQIEAMMAKQMEISKTTPFLNTEMGQYAYQLGFEDGVDYTLSHQWISIEDKLPPFEENVLVKIKWENLISDAIRHRTSNPEVYVDKNKFAIYDDEFVTHWMPIPQLTEEGGEE